VSALAPGTVAGPPLPPNTLGMGLAPPHEAHALWQSRVVLSTNLARGKRTAKPHPSCDGQASQGGVCRCRHPSTQGAKPALQGIKSCYKIADFIWYELNDQSTDFNFYTKRMTLSKIILRSSLVFVKDESQNFNKTKNFVDSQIAKVMKFEKCKIQVKKFVSEAFLDQNGVLKSPTKIVKSLPFFRLIKSYK
jgi:hypothetical protein